LDERILDFALSRGGEGGSEFHGFALSKHLADKEGAKRLVGQGTIYKALDRLRRNGLLDSRWEDSELAEAEHRPRRRLYRVTGEAALALNRSRAAQSASVAPRSKVVLP